MYLSSHHIKVVTYFIIHKKHAVMYKSLLFLIFCFPLMVSAQSAVGTSTPHASAKFEVYSTNQGFLAPRIALTGTNDATTIKNSSGTTTPPATGLMVYNTATAGSGSTAVTPGYYSYNGSSWERMGTPSTTIVDGTVGSYRVTPLAVNATEYPTGYDVIGSITLPTGKWEIIADYTAVLQFDGDFGTGVAWTNSLTRLITYWLNSGGGSGVVGFDFPAAFTSGEVTTHTLVSGGAVVTIPFTRNSLESSQKMSFLINNQTGSDQTYSLRMRESIAGWGSANNGATNSYYNSSSSSRLYAVKIQ
jgi:hypothetical protein